MYRVIGSQQPTKGLEVTYSGAISGPSKKTGRIGERSLLFYQHKRVHYHSYTINHELGVISGDSGNPIYTIPDTNGNVHIVGIVKGNIIIAGKVRHLFASWDEATEYLSLKPISP